MKDQAAPLLQAWAEGIRAQHAAPLARLVFEHLHNEHQTSPDPMRRLMAQLDYELFVTAYFKWAGVGNRKLQCRMIAQCTGDAMLKDRLYTQRNDRVEHVVGGWAFERREAQV